MTKVTILGGLSYTRFLRDYWQKKPLLIRQAFPNFKSFVSKDDLISLSTNENIQSRLVAYERKKWKLEDGPFGKSQLRALKGIWALLVQGVNNVLPEAQELLKEFSFIPYARLDDLMISYATPGGGVGPHVDSYDVFLLQGYGKRLWQISDQKDQALLENTPLKILKKFKPTAEWILEPGDMLYLPPNYAHHGIALDECMTYSIGFRAPTHQELAMQFFGYLQDNYQVKGIYQDPDLKFSKEPARISNEMIKQVSGVIKKIRFDKSDIEIFLGRHLTETKPNIIFDAPDPIIKIGHFLKYIKKSGLILDPKSQMLYIKNTLFMNGECYCIKDEILKDLANNKIAPPLNRLSDELGELLYQWYLDGYVVIN